MLGCSSLLFYFFISTFSKIIIIKMIIVNVNVEKLNALNHVINLLSLFKCATIRTNITYAVIIH